MVARGIKINMIQVENQKKKPEHSEVVVAAAIGVLTGN
jgi:hypothetical protein